jgi:triacylglycerol esterase/lipase EstA (alpha/beta hydrolase family)
MKHILSTALALVILLGVEALAGQAYDLKVIAQSGQAVGATTVQSIRPALSINDKGHIAFIATGADGDALFRWNGVEAQPLADSSSGLQFKSASINTNGEVAATLFANAGGYSLAMIKRYFANGSSDTLHYAGSLVIMGTPFYDMATFGDYVTVNGLGTLIYFGVDHEARSWIIANNVIRALTPSQALSSKPALSENERIATWRNYSGPAIQLFTTLNLAVPEAQIANSSMGFTSLGKAPGISDDASIVVFCGDRGRGLGVFASIRTNTASASSPRMVVRIAGEDTGPGGATNPPCIGWDAQSNALYFTSFSLDSRVGIVHFPGGQSGPSQDSFTVCFTATPNRANAGPDPLPFSLNSGLWAMRLEISTNLEVVAKAVFPVVQVDDPVPGGSGSITGLTLHDPIARIGTDESGNPVLPNAREHRLAFWVSTAQGNALLQATHAEKDITLHQLRSDALDLSPPSAIDSPLSVLPDREVLQNQPKVGQGLVADGVTPLLIKFQPAQPPATPVQYHINVTNTDGGFLISSQLQDHVLVLAGSQFVQGAEVEVSSQNPIAFAYINAIDAEDISFQPGKNELAAAVEITDGSGRRWVREFKIRRPPIVLVHGYASDKKTWGQPWLDVLTNTVPSGFVAPINYGVDTSDPKSCFNTYGRLDELAWTLHASLWFAVEAPSTELRRNWAFTRYDAVGHSQGGVLLRMLCTRDGKFTPTRFRDAGNNYRGRFRRVITIGSPHNGSTFLYWLLCLRKQGFFLKQKASFPVWFEEVLAKNLIQEKFDPFGEQMTNVVNGADSEIDDGAKFHLLSATIAGGAPSGQISCPKIHWVHLCDPLREPIVTPFSFPIPIASRCSEIVIPFGSDGIVDLKSQEAGGLSANFTNLSAHDISHSSDDILPLVSVFGVDKESCETRDTLVASTVCELLGGPTNAFGKFVLPTLDAVMGYQKEFVDDFLPTHFIQVTLQPQPSPALAPKSMPKGSGAPTDTVEYRVELLPGEPPSGPVNWSVTVCGTNGFSWDGLTLQTDTNDSTHVTVIITNPIVGDIVLAAWYQSTNDHFIFFTPTIVRSEPSPDHLTAIEVVPASLARSIGDRAELELWGTYDNGVRRLLFTGDGATFSSSDTNVAEVLSTGLVTFPTNGSATITASFNGHSAQTVLTVRPLPPLFPTNIPPIAMDDVAQTVPNQPVTVNVLANDSDPDGTLDPGTVTLTAQPGNGTATVDPYTGAITYTPNPGFAGTNTFAYTVQDDLGSTSGDATVTVVVAGIAQSTPLSSPPYLIEARSEEIGERGHPRINNNGAFTYRGKIGENWQVFATPTPEGAPYQLTFADGIYDDADSPSVADDGTVVCVRSHMAGAFFRTRVRDLVRYPGPQEALTNPSPTVLFAGYNSRRSDGNGDVGSAGAEASCSSDGRIIWNNTLEHNSFSGSFYYSYLGLVGGGNLALDDQWSGSSPDVNADGHFVYGTGWQIYLDNVPTRTGQFPHINDIPRDLPDIVSVQTPGNRLVSARLGQLYDRFGQPLTGNWADINRSGVIIFEQAVGNNTQIFKGYPLEPRIVSAGATNAVVGLPYRYDSDNLAEAYGGEQEVGDPRDILPLSWSKVSGPDGFKIDQDTGRISWLPDTPGTFVIQIRAAVMYLEEGVDYEDIQALNVHVDGPTISLVDATDFRLQNSPLLPTNPTAFFTGGAGRMGAQADGASRLVLRAELKGVDTNSFAGLHFAISGTNGLRDGRLQAIGSSNWALDVPAALASAGGTNQAICLYEAPIDHDVASAPVVVQLLSGSNVVSSCNIQLRRPPVVLIHDGWSGPDAWPLVADALIDQGFDYYVADYSYTSGTNLFYNLWPLVPTVNAALAERRSMGFAASKVDMVGHGAGGLLARLHVQEHSAQDINYQLGDVHKLITIGTPHGGSYLAGIINALRTNNPTAYSSLRNGVLTASESFGLFPSVDLSQGLVADETPGGTGQRALEAITVPSHALVSTSDSLPPGDLLSFVHFALAAPSQGDGLTTVESGAGALPSNAVTVISSLPHDYQPYDTNVAALVADLLKQPIALSNRFGYFPDGKDVLQGAPEVQGPPLFGNWLVLQGATNGQAVGAGQILTLTATASDARSLDQVQCSCPVGAQAGSTAPFEFTVSIPSNGAGGFRVVAAARDTNGEMALASLLLKITNAATLQAIEVDPPLIDSEHPVAAASAGMGALLGRGQTGHLSRNCRYQIP